MIQDNSALLLSGGMDSMAVAYWKRPKVAFTIDYGQRSSIGEIRAATEVARRLAIDHYILTADCKDLGSGDLAGTAPLSNAPATEWWPFRNQLLLTLAGMKAVALDVKTLMFGSVSTDKFHADGTPEFFELVNRLFGYQEGRLTIAAPAIGMTTLELIKHCGIPRSLLSWSHSCHVSDFACGHCRGCVKLLSVLNDLDND